MFATVEAALRGPAQWPLPHSAGVVCYDRNIIIIRFSAHLFRFRQGQNQYHGGYAYRWIVGGATLERRLTH